MRNKVYNGIKLVVGVSAYLMSVEYFFFWVQYRNYYYILDLIAWCLFGGIMIGEAFIGLTQHIFIEGKRLFC